MIPKLQTENLAVKNPARWFTDRIWLLVFGISATMFLMGLLPAWVAGEDSGFYTLSVMFFEPVCHQFSNRCYYIGELAMPVCSRCFGIYSGLFLMTVLIPFLRLFRLPGFNFALFLLVASVFLNIIDNAGNFFNWWSNTLTSRYLLGLPIGLSAVYVIFSEYIPGRKTKS